MAGTRGAVRTVLFLLAASCNHKTLDAFVPATTRFPAGLSPARRACGVARGGATGGVVGLLGAEKGLGEAGSEKRFLGSRRLGRLREALKEDCEESRFREDFEESRFRDADASALRLLTPRLLASRSLRRITNKIRDKFRTFRAKRRPAVGAELSARAELRAAGLPVGEPPVGGTPAGKSPAREAAPLVLKLVKHGDVGAALEYEWMQETLCAMAECGASSSVGSPAQSVAESGAGRAPGTPLDLVMEKAGEYPCLAGATRSDAARFLGLKGGVVQDALNAMLAKEDWLEARLYG
ncbi:hypothetical protein T484DRAFT_1889593, partial [Baffinella frigidus]